jgi:phosphatidylglycerophosphate synthase
MTDESNRRPIAARNTGWALATARLLARRRVTPNQISVLSVLFATAGTAALLAWPDWRGMLACALAILLRLLCNLVDGMVAVEAGHGATPVGALYNDVPDRIADSMFLVALGYAAGMPWLGWLAALLAVATAYIRALGGALGLAQDFRGPMAKPHRMWLLGIALVFAALAAGWAHAILLGAAVVIAAGSALTCVLRLRAITTQLRGPR